MNTYYTELEKLLSSAIKAHEAEASALLAYYAAVQAHGEARRALDQYAAGGGAVAEMPGAGEGPVTPVVVALPPEEKVKKRRRKTAESAESAETAAPKERHCEACGSVIDAGGAPSTVCSECKDSILVGTTSITNTPCGRVATFVVWSHDNGSASCRCAQGQLGDWPADIRTNPWPTWEEIGVAASRRLYRDVQVASIEVTEDGLIHVLLVAVTRETEPDEGTERTLFGALLGSAPTMRSEGV